MRYTISTSAWWIRKKTWYVTAVCLTTLCWSTIGWTQSTNAEDRSIESSDNSGIGTSATERLVAIENTTNQLAERSTQSCTVRMKQGSYVTGELIPSNDDNTIELRTSIFDQPIQIDMDAIQSAAFAKRDKSDTPKERPVGLNRIFTVQLLDGQTMVGQLTDLNSEHIRIQSPVFGLVDVPRNVCRSLKLTQGSDQIVFDGPFEPKTWVARAGTEGAWTFDADVLATTTRGASIVGGVPIPPQSRVCLTLSWAGAAQFKLDLGSGKIRDNAVASKPFLSLQILRGNLVLVCETRSKADLAILKKIEKNENRLELELYFDRRNGTVLAFDQWGEQLGALEIVSDELVGDTGVQLCNLGKSLTLEMLQIMKWDGKSPHVTAGNQILTETGIVHGALIELNRDNHSFVVQGADGEQTMLKLDAFISAKFEVSGRSSPPEAATNSTVSPQIPAPDRSINEVTDNKPTDESDASQKVATESSLAAREPSAHSSEATAQSDASVAESADSLGSTVDIRFHDGSKLRGQWLSSKNNFLCLQPALLPNSVNFPPAAVYVLSGNNRPFPAGKRNQINGKLVATGLELEGSLSSVSDASDNLQLVWEAHGCLDSLPISVQSTGRIEYRTVPRKLAAKPENAVANAPANANVPGLNAMEMFLGGRAKGAAALAAPKPTERKPAEDEFEIEFNNGDTFYGHLESIDERTVTIRSTQAEIKKIDHSLMQSAVLHPLPKKITLDSAKIQRLRVVPRNQKNDPPTHLLISTNGDILRGRLISLNAEELKFEVKLHKVEIDRKLVHKIIWLHERDWEENKKTGETAEDEPKTLKEMPFQVHAMLDNNRGLTFEPRQLTEGNLSGHSELLGNCTVDLRDVMVLYFGRDMASSIAEAKENPWRLGLAQYPRVYTAEEGGDSPSTAHSHLIDAAAPAFGLRNADGEMVTLASFQGKVVVLDFWASWCGPCMHTMPIVDKVASDFSEDVELVAINIGEPAERALAAIKRLDLTTNVLLDSDGEVATAYAAEAIPETVIIDREGVVRKVYVGVSDSLESDLKTAIQAILDKP